MLKYGFLTLLMILGPALWASPAAANTACAAPVNAAALLTDAANGLNAARTRLGRSALGRNADLDAAAHVQACYMSRTGKFSHKGSGGSSPKTRVKRTGYRTCLTAENIASGQDTGARVMSDWMASAGHRKNILNGRVREFGLAVSLMGGRPTWVMVLARPC